VTSSQQLPVAGAGDMTAADVVIGIVTFRRPESLQALLQRIVRLRFPSGLVPRVHLLVVDNSPGLEGRPVVEALFPPTGLSVEYVAHGAGNIASGRNAVLRQAVGRAPLLALIDDDELPAPEWLDRLLEAHRRTAADLVCGPVLADYPVGAPGWVRRPVFHSVTGDGPGWVSEAHAGNALVSTELVRRLGLSFAEELGTSGGEDQLFSRQAAAGGARIWFEPSALVHEPVPPERSSARYLLRREYRKGGTLGVLDRSRPGWPAGQPARRVLKAGYWALTGLVTVVRAVLGGDRAGVVVGLMRVARAGGMTTGLLGRTFDLYAPRTAVGGERPVVAVVAAEAPQYQHAGHAQHLRGFLDHHRALGRDVVVVVTGARTGFLVRRVARDGISYRAPSLRTVAGWQVVTSPRAAVAHLAWALFRRLPRGAQGVVDRARTALRSRADVDHVLGGWLDGATSAWVCRELDAARPDVVLFNTVFSVPDPLVLPSSVRVKALISHDVVHQRAQSFQAAGHRVAPADFTAEQEAAVLARMDVVAAIQWDDAETLAALTPAAVVVTPVVVGSTPAPRELARPGRCLFVGSGSFHNVEGLEWFLREAWPEVLRRRPDSRLHVVGTVCARLRTVPAGVVLRGEVDSLVDEYAAATVVVAPLRSGSGLKVKVVEALCAGVATVTTTVGAQGLSRLQPRPCLLADTAAGFADAVTSLLGDPEARRGLEDAAASAAPLFSADQAHAQLDRYLDTAGIGSRRGPTDPTSVPRGRVTAS